MSRATVRAARQEAVSPRESSSPLPREVSRDDARPDCTPEDGADILELIAVARAEERKGQIRKL